MPILPKAKKKPWQTERVAHKRVKDMRWFYNDRRWRKFSKQYKKDNPLCINCESKGLLRETKRTDHKLVYELCPEGFDLNNLQAKYMQPLCVKCHLSKSGKEAHINKIK